MQNVYASKHFPVLNALLQLKQILADYPEAYTGDALSQLPNHKRATTKKHKTSSAYLGVKHQVIQAVLSGLIAFKHWIWFHSCVCYAACSSLHCTDL